jgi:flagellin-like hook-associated protein FlgL
LGATQRYDLEAARSSMEITVQNLTAAQSQIMDTDYAREMAGLVRDIIKVRAGTSVLAHSILSNRLVDDLMK